MPETYSNGRKGSGQESAVLPWFTAQLDWPLEIVVGEAQVVTSREPSVFDWVTVQILREFQNQPPTLAEAAQELGMNDPVFLVEALRGLEQSGAVERQDPEASLDFANCRLTSAGEAFLEQGRLCSRPERHGLRLCMDLVTGEHVPQPPRSAREQPRYPVIPLQSLPARQTTIGLDRTRELAERQEEPFLTAGSKISDVVVHYEEGSIIWSPCEVDVSIDSTGTMRCQLRQATAEQQRWLDQLDLRLAVFDRILRSPTSQPSLGLSTVTKQHDQWRLSVDRLVAPAQTSQAACDLVQSARHEIVMHDHWLSLPEVGRELDRAVAHGVHHITFSQHTSTGETIEALSGHNEDLITIDSPGAHDEVVLLADGLRGLSIDRIELSTPRGTALEVIATSSLRAARVAQLHEKLLAMASSA